MKKFIVTAALSLFGIIAFCQKEETNGTIFIKHPYIEVVNSAVKAYLAKEQGAGLYSDTAQYWASGMEKFIPMADAGKMLLKHFDFYTDITMAPFGYPDYLQYKKDDSKVVQSWWTWSGKSKKNGEVLKISMVMFNDFNKEGKILREYIFGDFSKMENQ